MIRVTLMTLALMGGTLAAHQPPPPRPEPMRGPEGMGHPGPGFPFKALGLSPDQEKAVHAAMDKGRAGEKALHKAAAAKEEALRAALEDPATPEAQLRALNAAASDARFQALLGHRALLLEINAILTPDQQAKAKRIRDAQRREIEAHHTVMEETGGPGEDRPGPPPQLN